MHVYEAPARAYNLKLLFSTTKFNPFFLTHQQIVLKYYCFKRLTKNGVGKMLKFQGALLRTPHS